jgi:hypothetical protein
MLPAGERTLRFYPRFDTEPYAIDEALAILKAAVVDILGEPDQPTLSTGPEIRVGALECPVEAVEVVDITPASFAQLEPEILAVEVEQYGPFTQYPPDVLRAGRRPMLQYPPTLLEATMSNPRAIGVALRDRISGRIIAYALGSALEDHDEEGVGSDARFGEGNTFYLQAMATLPSVQNQVEIENHVLEAVRARAQAAGFEYLSTLIEERIHETGPDWFRQGTALRVVDNYLRSGIRFVYVQASLAGPQSPAAASEKPVETMTAESATVRAAPLEES